MTDKPEIVEVTLPPLVEGTTEYTIRYLKRPGDHVLAEQPVIEVETDKVSIELRAPQSGVIESLSVVGDAVVRVGDPIYRLRTDDTSPRTGLTSPRTGDTSPRTGLTSPRTGDTSPRTGLTSPLAGVTSPRAGVTSPLADDTSQFPILTVAQHVWDVSHLRARARSLAPTAAEQPLAESALLLVAVCRALASAPNLLRRRARWTDRGARILTTLCDVWLGGARWLESDLALDLSVDAALALVRDSTVARPTATTEPTLKILRLHGDTPQFARTGQADARLKLTIGPVVDQPIVQGGAVVIRPIAQLVIESDAQTTADELIAFTAALAEQLAHV